MPIVIKLNGKEMELAEGMTVGQLLDSRKIRREMVTVQVNGVIIDRNQFDTTPLKDGDEVEFLYYMGGGAKVVGYQGCVTPVSCGRATRGVMGRSCQPCQGMTC